ncbi:hypothetical protein [Sphingomonas sp.]|uniref:hypothetical protein n=1 Tax=Sphingomonas sp. TaxID=28214 RepID=UPI003B00674F
MVRALLAGRKTQTRRIVSKRLPAGARYTGIHYASDERDSWFFNSPSGPGKVPVRYEQGDRLYVRESVRFWAEGDDCEITFVDDRRRQTGPCTGDIPDASLAAYFRLIDRSYNDGERRSIGIPSIHMPRWASRLTLIVEEVRVEPLQEISVRDAIAEGLNYAPGGWWSGSDGQSAPDPVAAYALLWNSLHTENEQRWQDNPHVVALTFRVERANIDQVATQDAVRDRVAS